MRLSPELMRLAVKMQEQAEMPERIKAYDAIRLAARPGTSPRAPTPPTNNVAPLLAPLNNDAKQEQFARALELGKAKESPDGETYSTFADGKFYAHAPDFEDEAQVDEDEFRNGIEVVRQLMGPKVDPHEAGMVMARAKDKYGSIDPMKLKQVIRLMTMPQPDQVQALPEKK